MSGLLQVKEKKPKALLNGVIISLLDLSAAAELKQTLLMTSVQSCRKLYAWQALSVLCPFVEEDLIPQINERLWPALGPYGTCPS